MPHSSSIICIDNFLETTKNFIYLCLCSIVVYIRSVAIEKIKRGYKDPHHTYMMTKTMKRLRNTILSLNRKSRRLHDVIQNKYVFKEKVKNIVNVPETYFIEYSPNIKEKLLSVPVDTFVLKPNHLSRGIGIRTLTKVGDEYRDINGDVLRMDDILAEAKACYEQQRLNIQMIKGIMAEQKITSHPDMRWYSQDGIADIRMIYVRKKFVMGLARFPTQESGSYGNIARGAKWGIFNSLGRIEHDTRFKSKQIENNKKIPFFVEMRDASQKVINDYGYIVQAVDMTVDEDGKVYVIESERTPQFELYLTKEGIEWMWGIVEEQSWARAF